jgi:acetyl esterase/lipase
MRILPVGLLFLVPALLAAAPPSPVETAAWEPAASAKAPATPAPPLRTDSGAGFETAPPLRPTSVTSAPLPPAPLAPVSAAKDYGPQRLNFPDGVAAAFDVPYQTLKGYRPLMLDLYQPRPRNYPLPLVVYVHGGGFGGGDSRHSGTFDDFPAALAALAAQGYVVASVNYRLSGEARFPAALLDVKAAIRWLKAHAPIDTTRVAVWGAGTGGQLAALAGVSCGVPALSASDIPADAPSDCVQAVIDWYGSTEVKTAATAAGFNATDSDLGSFLGGEPAACPPGLAKLASPLSYVSATSPSFLILHGGDDTAVPAAQSQALAAALKAKGAPAELVIYPGMGQGFSRNGLADSAMNRQAMEKTASFLAGTFPPGPIGVKTATRRGPVY